MKLLTKSAIFLAIIAALLSFAKFDHCRNFGWGTPDVYVHACYSDLPALLVDRGMIDHTWPYSSATNAVEYPPITGIVMWATSFIVKKNFGQYRAYFDFNALLIALIFIGSVALLRKMKPEFWYLFPIAPAVIASLYINWDIWAVISALGAIYYFDRKKYPSSALLLGISVATKFFPIVLLLPIALIFFRRREIQNLFKYFALTFATWIIINLPFILTTPVGWFRFFKLNSERGADWGSIWEALAIFGKNVNPLNLFSILLFLIGITAYTIIFLGIKKTPTLAATAFFVVAIFVTASKVYSPQYIIWLTPLAVLALVDKRDRIDFWIWQGAELIYHFAIWQYLATITGTHFAISGGAYATATLLRIAALFWFSARLMRKSTPEIDAQSTAFLTSASSGYA
jgi:uncharacterized membrane protein